MAKRKRKELRWGFSTGTAAAAATHGAMLVLLGKKCPASIDVPLPAGGTVNVPVHACSGTQEQGECRVIKDAGDDPDVTHGAEIGARVGFLEAARSGVELVGGRGVGWVTKPGLPISVGETAINPVPRRMIRAVVQNLTRPAEDLRGRGLRVEIFVENGEELARRTLNPRLGIIGGLSILGNTGLVKPYSHSAYRATIASALDVASASHRRKVVFSTGGKSEEHARRIYNRLPEESFVQMGDYVRFALHQAQRRGVAAVTVVCFFGKALKIAQGMVNTHASRGIVDLQGLACLAERKIGRRDWIPEIAVANTARHALEIIEGVKAWVLVEEVGKQMLEGLRRHAGSIRHLEAIILDFFGRTLWRGEKG